jgi:hypothetical protein
MNRALFIQQTQTFFWHFRNYDGSRAVRHACRCLVKEASWFPIGKPRDKMVSLANVRPLAAARRQAVRGFASWNRTQAGRFSELYRLHCGVEDFEDESRPIWPV